MKADFRLTHAFDARLPRTKTFGELAICIRVDHPSAKGGRIVHGIAGAKHPHVSTH
jgi:hypothetical protein